MARAFRVRKGRLSANVMRSTMRPRSDLAPGAGSRVDWIVVRDPKGPRRHPRQRGEGVYWGGMAVRECRAVPANPRATSAGFTAARCRARGRGPSFVGGIRRPIASDPSTRGLPLGPAGSQMRSRLASSRPRRSPAASLVGMATGPWSCCPIGQPKGMPNPVFPPPPGLGMPERPDPGWKSGLRAVPTVRQAARPRPPRCGGRGLASELGRGHCPSVGAA